jgi:hypothetical protein
LYSAGDGGQAFPGASGIMLIEREFFLRIRARFAAENRQSARRKPRNLH